MPRFVPSPWSVISRALRGAVIGVAVWGIFALSSAYAEHEVEQAAARSTADLNGVEILGSIVITTLVIAVPASLVAGFVLAWALRLRRPWIVPPLGLLFDCLLGLVAVSIHEGPMTDWERATILALSFAAAAIIPLTGRWTSRDALPAGETPTAAGPGGQA
ncbi:MAG: hypothetical protein IRY85_11190 [Micromonosporaceae bacterium]|nr:hypothetical protein [Micromonosporaceae bacterium]